MFTMPEYSFHDDHMTQQGAYAPHAFIKIHLFADEDACSAGPMVVEIEDASQSGSGGQAQALLASGEVRCTGDWELHQLPIGPAVPLSLRRVSVFCRCGTERAHLGGGPIWLRNP